MSAWRDRVGDLTLFEALTGGAFGHLNRPHSGEFNQNFFKKSNAPGFARLGLGGFGIARYISLNRKRPKCSWWNNAIYDKCSENIITLNKNTY